MGEVDKKVSFWDFRLWAVFGACLAALGRAGWITRVLDVAKRPEMTRVLPRGRFATWRSDAEVTVPAPDESMYDDPVTTFPQIGISDFQGL